MDNNKICISLPPDGRWMRFAQESLRLYSEMVGFSPKLEEMCGSSVMEACEELVRRAAAAGVLEPIDLRLDYKGETIVIDIAYSGRIPLNPLQVEDYEIPDAATGLDDIDMETLWLHMIKRRMDRVRFMVQGSRHVLRMIKYRRDAGKEKQAWVMTITPELRQGVFLHLDATSAEHPGSTLQAMGTGVLMLNPSQTFIVRNIDGKTSFHDLYMAHLDALGLTSPKMLAALYEKLEAMGMLVAPGAAARQTRTRLLVKKILNPNFSIPNADGVVAAVQEKVRFLYSPFGVAALLVLGLSGILPAWQCRTQFAAALGGLEERFLISPLLLLPVYLLTLIHVSLHELGHGVTCKHFGGVVPRLGAMFYLASFIFYCDTTAAWTFPEKRQRILVSLAGPLTSFAILGAGLWAAGHFAGTGSSWEPILVAFCLLSMFGLVMNFNPFIKMDAYYILLDLTGIPNLRERSFKFLERKAFGWLGVGVEENAKATLFERKVFWWYGIIGGVLTLFFLALPLIRLQHLLSAHSVSGGRLFFAALVGTLLLARLGSLAYTKVKSVRFREYKIQ